ncbi:thioredoxin [uncultured Sunxiuqinia sp.]|uniref:thioredoxin n=1 Tax=uncultured Sunxiuqinia sp. TaxID=1573825 RepID=UPI002AA63787|nr:thioredoxin [uncultured Sunxiuqinia sp.]
MAQIIIGILALVIVGFFILAKVAKNKMKNTPMVDDHKNIITLTDKNFQQKTKNKLVLVDFWASWCAPCKMMAPILNDVSEELNGNSYIGKVNIEQYQILAQKFKVRNIPTLILFRNGKEVGRFVGIKSKKYLLNEIAKAS